MSNVIKGFFKVKFEKCLFYLDKVWERVDFLRCVIVFWELGDVRFNIKDIFIGLER